MAMGPCAASFVSRLDGLLGCLSGWAGCLFFFFLSKRQTKHGCLYILLTDTNCNAGYSFTHDPFRMYRARNENLFVLQMQHSSIISAYHYHLISYGHIISD